MSNVIEMKKEKKTYVTTIVVETSYDPKELGATSILMDVCQGGGNLVSKTTEEKSASQKESKKAA